MGPSRKDQRGPPLFFCRSCSNALIFCQNFRTARSWAGKSTCVSTFSNGMMSLSNLRYRLYLIRDTFFAVGVRPRSCAMNPIRIAVLLSGGGTTLQNFLDRIADKRLNAKVVRVVSSHVAALGLTRAEVAGIPTTVVERKKCASRAEFSRRIFDACGADGAELVCMGGFLQLVEIPTDFMGRVMNIHPSLIPAFCGKGFHGRHVHESALAMGVKVSGCTVHFADNEYD